MSTPEMIECGSLIEAMQHVQSLEEAANLAVGKYHEAVRQLTGINPGKPMSPMDIVKIWHKLENPSND